MLLRRPCTFLAARTGSPWCRVRIEGPTAERGCAPMACRLTVERLSWVCMCVRQVNIDDVETVDDTYFKSPAWLTRGIDRMAITLLVLSGMVKTIGDRGFFECKGLTSLTLGASVESIGRGAFNGCFRLASL
eukprot:530101-Prymnesium_polylepis.1